MKKIILGIAAALLLAGSIVFANHSQKANDCCGKGQACCYPGSPCCKK